MKNLIALSLLSAVAISGVGTQLAQAGSGYNHNHSDKSGSYSHSQQYDNQKSLPGRVGQGMKNVGNRVHNLSTSVGNAVNPFDRDTIPGVANQAGQFNTLLKAIDKAGLKNDLMGEGPYTVFAPTDDAFRELGMDNVEDLLQPQNRMKLQNILKYHVVKAEIPASLLSDLDDAEITTLSGEKLTLDKTMLGDELQVNDADIINQDVRASNGVIHVINKVLMPN